MKKIVFLYSNVMGYVFSCLKNVAENEDVEIHLFHWENTGVAPYRIPACKNITAYPKPEWDRERLSQKLLEIRPDAVYISGWMDKDYLAAAKMVKKQFNTPIISGLDNHWKGGWKQQLLAASAPFTVRKWFDYIWYAGIYQYEFARRLGFSRQQLLPNVYSADVSSYTNVFNEQAPQKIQSLPKNILFVGRFVPAKGIDLLVDAFSRLDDKTSQGWTLTLIGNGPLKEQFANKHPRIIIKDFMQPQELLGEVAASSVFCLPSVHEPWGVVVHEFAAAGMPLICSDAVGAATAFLRNGYNGYSFKSGNAESLKQALQSIMSLAPDKISLMGKRSSQLAQSINPDMWRSTLMSIINGNSSH